MLELSARPAEAILGRTVTLRFSGGLRYVLPVLTIAENRRWKAELDAETASLVDALSASGDDAATILGVLATQTDKLVDLLYSYDTSGVLPARDVLEGIAYEDEILAAVQEVWQAANPLVVMALAIATTEATTDARLIAAYERVAADYGWTPAQVERELSDEQLVAYLDAAADRLERQARVSFESRVEAARVAAIFASSKAGDRAYQRWRRRVDRDSGRSPSLSGETLEGAIMALAVTNPEYVVVGPG